MNIFLFKRLEYIIIIFSLCLLHCDLQVPLKEMAQAKKGMSRAQYVRADLYASEEYKEAAFLLLQSHREIAHRNVEIAQENALASIKFSEAAIKKSLPAALSDTLKIAREQYAALFQLFAEHYAKVDLDHVHNVICEAEKLYADNDFWSSYTLSLQAIDGIKDIRRVCFSHRENLQKRIVDLKEKVDQLRETGGNDFARDEVASLLNHLAEALEDLKQQNIKQAYHTIRTCENDYKDLYMNTCKGTAAENITIALHTLRQVQLFPSCGKYGDTTDLAEEYIVKSQELFNDEFYNESIMASDEAIMKLAYIIKILKVDEEKIYANKMLAIIEKNFSKIKENHVVKHDRQILRQAYSSYEYSKEYYSKTIYNLSISQSQKTLRLLAGLRFNNGEIRLLKEGDIERKFPISPPTEEKGGLQCYRVQKGDFLLRVANRVYGNPALWPHIYRANRDKLKDPDVVYPGQILLIPVISSEKKKIQ